MSTALWSFHFLDGAGGGESAPSSDPAWKWETAPPAGFGGTTVWDVGPGWDADGVDDGCLKGSFHDRSSMFIWWYIGGAGDPDHIFDYPMNPTSFTFEDMGIPPGQIITSAQMLSMSYRYQTDDPTRTYYTQPYVDLYVGSLDNPDKDYTYYAPDDTGFGLWGYDDMVAWGGGAGWPQIMPAADTGWVTVGPGPECIAIPYDPTFLPILSSDQVFLVVDTDLQASFATRESPLVASLAWDALDILITYEPFGDTPPVTMGGVAVDALTSAPSHSLSPM